jgi:hypothetical protein
MSAWVSPPQPKVSHIVDVAANIAQAASTALPPREKIMAPAVAASGLPVTATQCLPCNTGFAVFWAIALPVKHNSANTQVTTWVTLRKAVIDWGERTMVYPGCIEATRITNASPPVSFLLQLNTSSTESQQAYP